MVRVGIFFLMPLFHTALLFRATLLSARLVGTDGSLTALSVAAFGTGPLGFRGFLFGVPVRGGLIRGLEALSLFA